MVKYKMNDNEKELVKKLKDIEIELREYREMLQRMIKENIELKRLFKEARFRGEVVKNYLYSLIAQTDTLRVMFGIDKFDEVNDGKTPAE